MVDRQPDGSLRATSPDSMFADVVASYVNPGGCRRDYRKITAPALFIFPATWLPAPADPARRRQVDEWHATRYQPVRTEVIERLRRELHHVTIVELGAGNHNNFFLTQRAQVLAAMRPFVAR